MIEESHPRLIVRLVLIIYFLTLFEGVLRKWIAPQWGRPLFFIRDPFVLAIYILVLSKRIRFRRGFLELGCLFGVAGLILTIGGRMLSTQEITPIFISAYGWRNYFLYLPLPFIIGRYFDLRDLRRLLAATSLISVAMAGLALAQFRSSTWAPINSGSGDTSEELYGNQGLPGGFVRPFGTFTSNQGMATFTVSAVTAAIYLWLTRSRSRSLRSYLLLACATVGSFSCLSLSGSRGAFVWSGLVIVLLILGVSLAPGGLSLKAATIVVVLILSGAVTAPVLFPEATRAFITRWSGAGEVEERAYGAGGIWGRAIYEVFSFHVLLSDTPLQGYGLGSAGNAAWRLGTAPPWSASPDKVAAGESDWGRHVLELGPIFGCLFILYRIALTIWLAKETLVATRRSGHPLPWLLFAFVGILIFNGQITGNGTSNAYAWLFTGFCLAAANGVATVGFPTKRQQALDWRPAEVIA
jgi:hypothetical protein